jgi:alanine racemase
MNLKNEFLPMKLLNFLRKIKKSFSDYRPSVEVLIFRENLLHNLNEYRQKYPGLSFAPVLKSNAYGHGLIQIAQILDKEKIAFLVVDSLFEAKALRSEGIKSQIVIMGYTSAENIKGSQISNAAFAITSLEQLREINRNLKNMKRFHLKIDTGMRRQGILPDEIEEAIGIIKQNKYINLEGVCSHLADADNENKDFTQAQIKQWEKAVQICKQNFAAIKFFHLSATAGLDYTNQFFSNVARLGIGLYGINSAPFVKMNLKPVLEMRSIISSVKNIVAGECVGYNATFRAAKELKIATLPVGYFEGVDRRLSNRGYVKIKNTDCPIVGKVSMNITSLDITLAPDVKLGDWAVIISRDPQDKNSAENLARLAETIPYEILIHVPAYLQRIIK